MRDLPSYRQSVERDTCLIEMKRDIAPMSGNLTTLAGEIRRGFEKIQNTLTEEKETCNGDVSSEGEGALVAGDGERGRLGTGRGLVQTQVAVKSLRNL